MPQRHIDFRSLLERVLPLDALTATERSLVQHALRSGVSERIEEAAMQALAQLERHGAMSRLPAGTNGDSQTIRYMTRDRLEVITLEVPRPDLRDGVVLIPRASLPHHAQTAIAHVRRLLRLDEPLFSSDPRTGDPRGALLERLDQVGRDLLGVHELRFVPAEGPRLGHGADPLSEAWISETLARPHVLAYCADTSRSEAVRADALRAGVRSFVLAAVGEPGARPLGVLEVRGGDVEPFDADTLALVALIADCCGSALERASRIERLVFVDPLTGAYNRPYFDLQMRNEIARAQRENASMALCIVDIDDFKSFNSRFGFEAGNQVLVSTVQALRRGVRPFDAVCRWGGEEFAVLLTPPVHVGDVRTITERLRSLVERQDVQLESLDGTTHHVAVTVSIGVAVYPDHETTPAELWRAANQALLVAKRPPKNQVVFYTKR